MGFTPGGQFIPGFDSGSNLSISEQAKQIAAGNTQQAGIQANIDAMRLGNAMGGGFPQVANGQVMFTQPNNQGNFSLSGFGGSDPFTAAFNQQFQLQPGAPPGLPNFGSQAPGFGGSFFGGGQSFNNALGVGQPGARQNVAGLFSGLGGMTPGNSASQAAQAGQNRFPDGGGDMGFGMGGGAGGTGGFGAGFSGFGGSGGAGNAGGTGGFSGGGQHTNNLLNSLRGTSSLASNTGTQPFNFNAVGGNSGVFANPFTTPGARGQTGFANRFEGGAGFRPAVDTSTLGATTLQTQRQDNPVDNLGRPVQYLDPTTGLHAQRPDRVSQLAGNQQQGFNMADPNAGRTGVSGFLRGPEDAQFLLDSGLIDQAMFDRILPAAQANASVSGPGTVQVPQGSFLPGGATSFGDNRVSSLASNQPGVQIQGQAQQQDPNQQHGMGLLTDPNGAWGNSTKSGQWVDGVELEVGAPGVYGSTPQQRYEYWLRNEGANTPQGAAFAAQQQGGSSQLAANQGPNQGANAGNPNASPGFQVGAGINPGIRQPFGDTGVPQGSFDPFTGAFNGGGNQSFINTGGGGGGGFSQTGGQGFDGGFQSRALLDAQGRAALNQFMNQLAPGFSGSIPGGIPADSFSFGEQAGIFSGDPAFLPGEAGPNLLGWAANLTMNRAGAQAQQNALADQVATLATDRLVGGPAVQGTENLLSRLAANPYTTSGDALQRDIEGIITRRGAENQQATLAGQADRSAAAGLGGGESSLLQAGSQFGSRAQLADDLAEARINQALRRQSDIQSAISGFGQGGQTMTNQLLNPSMQLAQFMRGSGDNALTDSFTEQLRSLGIASIEEELRENADNSALNNFLAILNGVNSTAQTISSFSGGG
jgi:hypothetical protein